MYNAEEVTDLNAVGALLESLRAAWNRGDIEGIVKCYRKSDDTAFVGARGIDRGWQAIRDRYLRDYPDREAFGQLKFSNLVVHVLGDDVAYAMGEFELQREKDNPSGFFSLVLKRFDSGWEVLLDHATGRVV